jgi:cell wall-associated NlpC family hydrolase
MEVCRRQGVNLPEYDYTDTAGMIENEAKAVLKDKRALKIDEPVDGALILFHTFKGLNTHIGIYVGDGLFIHSRIGRGVCLERLRPYKNCITGVYVWQG